MAERVEKGVLGLVLGCYPVVLASCRWARWWSCGEKGVLLFGGAEFKAAFSSQLQGDQPNMIVIFFVLFFQGGKVHAVVRGG